MIMLSRKNSPIEDPCSDSTALGHEQVGLELTAERLGPNGARRSQAVGNALAFAVHIRASGKDCQTDPLGVS